MMRVREGKWRESDGCGENLCAFFPGPGYGVGGETGEYT
jgi:hypothetical protein